MIRLTGPLGTVWDSLDFPVKHFPIFVKRDHKLKYSVFEETHSLQVRPQFLDGDDRVMKFSMVGTRANIDRAVERIKTEEAHFYLPPSSRPRPVQAPSSRCVLWPLYVDALLQSTFGRTDTELPGYIVFF